MTEPLQLCRIEIPNEGSILLHPDQPSDESLTYYGEGLEKGECGITIWSIKEQHDGNITCYLVPKDSISRKEASNSIRLIVNSCKFYINYHTISKLLNS